MSGEATGWWGCLNCGSVVSNTHTGPCTVCGERIGRILPSGASFEVDVRPIPRLEQPVPQPKEVKSDWNHAALAVALILCVGSPLLVAASASFNAVAMGIWSSGVGYYALVKGRESTHA